jgi:hypothetical protein
MTYHSGSCATLNDAQETKNTDPQIFATIKFSLEKLQIQHPFILAF